MQIDPLLSLLVGALGAAVLGLIGAWIQSRREHAKWLREKRYDAHLAYLVLNDRYATKAELGTGPKTEAEIDVALEALNEIVSAISMLGPESVLDEARTLRLATSAYIEAGSRPEGHDVARQDYILASRKALGVSNRG